MTQIKEEGYDNFKRTLNLKYFNFVPDILNDQFINLVKYWLIHPTLKVFLSKFRDYSPFRLGKDNTILTKMTGGIIYKLFVSMLWEYTRHIDRGKLLQRIEEPLQGNPLRIYYRNRLISQDLCNSIIEYYSIMDALPEPSKSNLNICELGAGYGRVGYIFLKSHKCKYTVLDIPPALYVAQRYLSAIFPELKTFKFRDFKHYDDIRGEFEDADIRFLTPNQIKYLPQPQFNLFINISSLHEMTMPQIRNYINLINECTNGCFYLKQWLHSINRQDGITISYDDYPVPAEWEQLYFRKCMIQSHFFETMYGIKQ
jgi:putative sugar O-methyltransferase